MPAANTYAAPGTTGGNREDLRDVLTILEPEATPVTSMLKKGPSPKATYVEVLADTLRASRRTGIPEGQDVNVFNNKAKNRARFGNYVHIWRDAFSVTDLQQLVDTAAVANEYGASKAKTVREVKRDIEATICGGQDMTQGDGDTGWVTRGYFSWCSNGAQSTNPVPANFRTPAAQISTAGTGLTETNLNNILQSLFQVYGEKRSFVGVLGTDLQEVVDLFTRTEGTTTAQRYQVHEYAAKQQITMMVKRFESSFGTVTFVPSVFVNTDTSGAEDVDAGMIFDPAMLEMQFLDSLHSMDLENQGGGDRGFVKAVGALCCKNPRGLAKITG